MLRIFLLVFISFLSLLVAAQNDYSMGIPETPDTSLEKMKQKTTLISANYKSLGGSASLKKFCPTPGDQGRYSTCAAWSTAYAARTIIETQKKGWSNATQITQHTFSPMFIYKLNNPYDDNCSQGAHPADLLELMQDKGVPLLRDFSVQCQVPGESDYAKARPYRINAMQKIFYHTPYQGNVVSTSDMLKIKKSLSEGNPVIISFVCPPSFSKAVTNWQPYESPLIVNNNQHGRHAVCIIGYDDDQYGGAFEIMNSWGTGWGNGGFTWVPYDVFRKFTYAAVELQKFEKEETLSKLSGSVQLLDINEAPMKATRIRDGHYKLNESYSSGTRFKLMVNNTEPTHMYVIGADANGNFATLFPYNKQVSASLNYPNSTVAIPSEQKHIRMDNNVGKDFMLVIYTKDPAYDIDKVISQLKYANGSFPQKVQSVLQNSMKKNKIVYDESRISFKSTEADKGDVVLLIEIDHI
ncbi:MAG: C1 family peptidase [Flavisolibacter sp.]